MSQIKIYEGLNDADVEQRQATTRAVAEQLAATVLARDRANRDPLGELKLLRDSGLLGLASSRAFGGRAGDKP